MRGVVKWKIVNVSVNVITVIVVNSFRGLHGFDSVELGGRVQVGKIQP